MPTPDPNSDCSAFAECSNVRTKTRLVFVKQKFLFYFIFVRCSVLRQRRIPIPIVDFADLFAK